MKEEEWRERERQHQERVTPWVEPRLERRNHGLKHPVDDFLFDYYPFSPGKLLSWHPGYGIELEGDVRQFLASPAYERTAGGGATATLEWLNPSRRARLALAIRILEGTTTRAANTGCFGLHEWAMVYGLRQEEIRHEQVPLRLSPEAVKATVDEVGLRCTHFDAFRFFTREAEALNASRPSRASQPDFEQPGCLHAAMDLYKIASWHSPLVSSDMVADCFELARRARELDMRASPYDVTTFGLEPIHVESVEGRSEYVRYQRELMVTATRLRVDLAAQLVLLDQAVKQSRC